VVHMPRTENKCLHRQTLERCPVGGGGGAGDGSGMRDKAELMGERGVPEVDAENSKR
jgi:hypothetical protein